MEMKKIVAQIQLQSHLVKMVMLLLAFKMPRRMLWAASQVT